MADISKVKLPDNVTYNLKDGGAVRKTGDTMTGNLILYREGTTTQNYPTQLFFQNKDTTTGKTSQGAIKGYDGGEYGLNMVINPAGNMFIGSGEAADNHYGLYPHNTGENFYATADSNMYLQANGQTIANRVGLVIDTDHAILPTKADVATNNVGSIGTSSYKWANGYFTNINGVAVGSSPKFTDNNTTYTLSADTTNNQIKLTPSSGTAQSVTVPYATSADSATNAYYLQDSVRTSYRLKYINTNDSTTANADTLGETTSIAITTTTPTGAPTTNHALWFNIKDIGTPFQLFFPDSQLYIYKRYKTSGTWGDWTKMRAGYADSAGSASKLSTNAGSATNPVYFTGGVPTACTYSLNKSVPSDAVFTDVNVKVNNTNPASGTWYYPTWYTATSGTGNVNANDGLRYYSLQGTASAAGRSILSLGNNTSTGTAGNKRGELFLYSEKSGRAEIVYTAAATATVVHTFPATAGTILNTGTTSFTQSLSSGTKIGTIKINGTSTDLYCQTNTNTHRPIQVNGTEILGNNTTALNLKAGSNVSVTNSSGTVTIAATDAKVTQSEIDSANAYEILLSYSDSTDTETQTVKKSKQVRLSPSSGHLSIYGTGNTLDILSVYYKDNETIKSAFSVHGAGNCSCGGTLGAVGDISTGGAVKSTGNLIAGGGLELGMASASTVPFIDFHWETVATDYTARLIQRAENTIDFMGKNSATWGTARAASFSSQSSIYVKENIYSITDDEAKKLLQLRPVIFDYKGDGLKNQRGLIAEEVMDVMPDMVIIPKGYKEYDPIEPWNTPCIDYSKFVPYLIKMVQIQQKEINELKARI